MMTNIEHKKGGSMKRHLSFVHLYRFMNSIKTNGDKGGMMMKQKWKRKSYKGAVFLMALLFLSVSFNHVFAQPDYAKWGKIAVEETDKNYPDFDLVNYEYQGKVAIADNREQYTFLFTMDQDGTKKKVRAYVLINPAEDQLIEVQFEDMASSSP
ncbi:DUF3889 domain-containing protein [Halobacillus litoralis]|nr:DUF3889 domain-containing protein [Halobacillus litoralis]